MSVSCTLQKRKHRVLTLAVAGVLVAILAHDGQVGFGESVASCESSMLSHSRSCALH